MNNAIHRELTHELAFNALKAGWPVLPCWDKQCREKDWPNLDVPWSRLSYLIRRGANIALRLDHAVVIDVDGPSGEEFALRHGLDSTSMSVITSKGSHYYFKIAEGVRTKLRFLGLEADCLTGNDHYSVAPFSHVKATDWTYTFAQGKRLVPPDELPELPPPLLGELLLKEPEPERKTERRAVQRVVSRTSDAARRVVRPDPATSSSGIRDLRSYIRRVPSVMGQCGSRGLMRVCYLLADRLDWAAALAELSSWNREIPQPEWSDAELVRALTRAFNYKRGTSE